MRRPIFALIGQPNVGKSTLFNRLTKTKNALVASIPGLTRDRQYGIACLERGNEIFLIDTGGLSGNQSGVDMFMAEQSREAIAESDFIIFVVDAEIGRTSSDDLIADLIRKSNKHCFLVVNKIDGRPPEMAVADFHSLGFGKPMPLAARSGRGLSKLGELIITHLLKNCDDDRQLDNNLDGDEIKIGIIGRPNVGKSTLVNRILGQNRMVVFDAPGTTRDAIEIPFTSDSKSYILIDTAGVRRRARVKEIIEKFSVIKTLDAIDRSNVIVLMIDAKEGIVDQDLNLIGLITEAGKALVLGVNKWDSLSLHNRQKIKTELDRRLTFIPWVEQITISALRGSGMGLILRAVDRAFRSSLIKIPTGKLNGILQKAILKHAPPLSNGRRIKLRYAHQGGAGPTRIIVHGNQTSSVPDSYRKYLENFYREALAINGSPIVIEFRTGENPFKGRKNDLTPRQVKKRSRLISYVKKN